MSDQLVFDALDAMIAALTTTGQDSAPVSPVSPLPQETPIRLSPRESSQRATPSLARVVSSVGTVENGENGKNGCKLFNKLSQNQPNRLLLARACRWHLEHGERVDAALCAGCRRPIRAAEETWTLADGNRVHIGPRGGEDTYACLIRWGDRWRQAALAAVGANHGDA